MDEIKHLSYYFFYVWAARLGLPGDLRGGSWNNNRINARAAYRNNNNLNNRNSVWGWRLARRSRLNIVPSSYGQSSPVLVAGQKLYHRQLAPNLCPMATADGTRPEKV